MMFEDMGLYLSLWVDCSGHTRPSAPGTVPSCPHPVVAWGNGTGGDQITSTYAVLSNNNAASWGIVVIASDNSNVGSGSYHKAAIDYMARQNADSSSIFYQKLSTRVGTSGHSQGGIGATQGANLIGSSCEAEVCVAGGGVPAEDQRVHLPHGQRRPRRTRLHGRLQLRATGERLSGRLGRRGPREQPRRSPDTLQMQPGTYSDDTPLCRLVSLLSRGRPGRLQAFRGGRSCQLRYLQGSGLARPFVEEPLRTMPRGAKSRSSLRLNFPRRNAPSSHASLSTARSRRA